LYLFFLQKGILGNILVTVSTFALTMVLTFTVNYFHSFFPK
jgi:hypothetical protein